MRHLSALNKYFLRYKRHLISGFIFILITNYFRILAPQITGYVVNLVVEHLKPSSPSSIFNISTHGIFLRKLTQFLQGKEFSEKIIWCGFLLLFTAVLSGLFMFLMRQTIIVMSRLIEYDQKNDIYHQYQEMDIGFYRTHATGDLMNRIAEDVSRVRMYTGPALMYFVNLAAVIGFSVYFMIKSDPTLTLYALLPLPILALTIYFVNSIINRKSETIQENLSVLTSSAQETYSGIRVVKSFVQEKAMAAFFKEKVEDYRKASLSLSKTEAIYFPSMALLIGVSTLITIMKGGMDVVHHVEGASVGKIAEFVMYIQMLTWPVSLIGWTASMIQRASASQKRINEFLQTAPEISSHAYAEQPDWNGDIEFSDVTFTYKNTGICSLKNFSLKIRKGDKLVIMGKTGSGKTTLAQLLMRFFDPEKGSITLNGKDLRNLSLKAFRSGISYVPQDVFLFSDSISNNIRFGNEQSTEVEIITATQKAQVYNDIMGFPEKFNTLLGERGINLSGGQKQRISLARAMMGKPQLLILDDCLSAVDTKTEKAMVESLNEFLRDKTAVICTHRILPTFNATNILVLVEGKIAEYGSHEELLKAKGFYFNIYQQQQMTENE